MTTSNSEEKTKDEVIKELKEKNYKLKSDLSEAKKQIKALLLFIGGGK